MKKARCVWARALPFGRVTALPPPPAEWREGKKANALSQATLEAVPSVPLSLTVHLRLLGVAVNVTL